MSQIIKKIFAKHYERYCKQKLIHLRCYNFDPVKCYDLAEKSDLPVKQHNPHYLIPFLVLSLIIADSVFFIATSDYRKLTDLDQLFSHKIFPKALRHEADVVIGTAFVMAFILFGVIIWGAELEQKFLMIVMAQDGGKEPSSVKIVQNGKVLDKAESAQIYKFHKKFEPIFRVVCLIIYIELESFYLMNLALNWSNSIRDYIYVVFVVVYFIYGTYSNILMIYYFVITTRYIRIKQKLIIQKLLKVIGQASKKRTSKLRIISEYHSIGQRNLRLYDEIHGHNRFWNKYLAVYYFCYIIEVCYLAYGFIFASNSGSIRQKVFFGTFSTEFLLLLLWVTYECSAIVHNHATIHKCERKFVKLARNNFGISVEQLLKFDAKECNQKWIRKIGFTLLESYQINSKMFEMLFIYISTLFMFILQHK